MHLATMRKTVIRAAVGIGCGAVLLGASVSTAAGPSLQTDAMATPNSPTASECTVAPVDLSSLMSLTTGGNLSTDVLTAEPVSEDTLPEGVPAIDEEVEGVTETVRQLVACANAGDPFRILALISPDLQAALAATALTATPEQAEELIGRFPVPLTGVDEDSPIEMIPIRDVRLLPDGRVGAILEPTIPGTDSVRVGFYVVFELVGDRWLMDDLVLLDIGLVGTPVATPAAG